VSNIEFALISRVIQDSDFRSLDRAKIDEDFFSSAEAKEIYRHLRRIYRSPATSGQVPSIDMLRQTFPSFQLMYAPDSVPVLCDHIRREKQKIDLYNLGQELITGASGDPQELLEIARERVLSINRSYTSGEDLSMADAYQSIREEYEDIVVGGGITGIPYPWDVLNQELLGMNPEEFIVIFGRPKSMKTWVALMMATFCYTMARKRVIFFSREMSVAALRRRIITLLARVDYSAFKKGQLQPHILNYVWTMASSLKEDEEAASYYGIKRPFLILLSDRGVADGGGMSWIRSKIEELDPDIVFIDGLYLMKDDRSKTKSVDWKNITNISQDAKGLARDFSIPVVGITQANRGSQGSRGEDLTEIGYADALGQDADVVYKINKVKNPETHANEIIVGMPGTRETDIDGFIINAIPSTDFSFIKSYSSVEEMREYGEKKKQQKTSGNLPGGSNNLPAHIPPPQFGRR